MNRDDPTPDRDDLPRMRPVSPEHEVLEPILVERTSEVTQPPVEPISPAPIFQSAAWCVLYIFLLIVAAGVVVGVDLAVQAQDAPNPEKFLNEQIESMDKGKGMTPAMGHALRWGFFAAGLVTVLFPLFLLRWRLGEDWPRLVGLRLPSIEHVALAVIGLPGLMLLHGGAHELFQSMAGAEPGNQNLGDMLEATFKPWPAWLTVLVIGVFPGIGEELFCRGFLGRKLQSAYGLVAGILFTSLFFGILHLMPTYALGTAVMGLMLHISYLLTRSLCSILLHFLNNAITALATTGALDVGAAAQDAKGPASVYAAAALLVLAVGWAMVRTRARLAADQSGRPLWRPARPTAEAPPPESGTVVVTSNATP